MVNLRAGILAMLCAACAAVCVPQAQAAEEPNCTFWSSEFGPKPAVTAPNGKPAKISFTPPPTMSLGRNYLFQFATAPADADGHLKVFFWSTTGADGRMGQIAEAMRAPVVDGKVVDSSGRRVDVPSMRVHPNLISRDWPHPMYLVASFRDQATGKYVCKKSPVSITFDNAAP